VRKPSALTDEGLQSLSEADRFRRKKTMRAKVIRELIDEIKTLRLSGPAAQVEVVLDQDRALGP